MHVPRLLTAAAATLSLAAAGSALAHADTYPSDAAKPDVIPLLSGFDAFWQPSGANDLHGAVKDAATLARNDELTVWINGHTTPAQRFRALQDAEYDTGSTYDQSVTIADGLGSTLGPLYAKGRQNGALPLTSALINSQTGTAGAYVSTTAAKARFSHPRPYLPADPTAPAAPGDAAGCAPSRINSSSEAANRIGKPYADAAGNLQITRVPDATDTTHAFSPNDVQLSPGYGTVGLCTGGSFPSGHTTTAYQAGLTLATLLPQLAPQILARASEAGNNRIVLGVHYPLDIIGGRIDGEVALATRWSDAAFRTGVLEPARKELVGYLEQGCGAALATCIARETSYTDDPYGGARIPGGTAQVVKDRASAAAVYRERLTYGFARVGTARRRPAVPAGAQSLLRTAFPTLTDRQRTAVLAQTEIASGAPLDGTGTAAGAWQRLDLAAALSAGVRLTGTGAARVVTTGASAQAVRLTRLRAPRGGRVRAGRRVTLTGRGFLAGERIRLVLRDGRRTVRLGTVVAGARGTVSRRIRLPRGVRGLRRIDALDATGASALSKRLRLRVR